MLRLFNQLHRACTSRWAGGIDLAPGSEGGPRRRRLDSPRTLGRTLLLSLLCASQTVMAADYKLGPQDRVRVKVIEWRASIGETYEWAALTGEYTINSDGRVFLPLVGEVEASGLNLMGLSKNISQGLKNRVGLVELLDTSVEIVQARPFYIVGSVERPGEFPYRTGLTVLQAVSVAGGFSRAVDNAAGRLDRESI